MPVIKPTPDKKIKKVNLVFNSDLLMEIREYCEWTGIKKTEEFLEKSAAYVFEKDKEWQKFCKEKRQNKGSENAGR